MACISGYTLGGFYEYTDCCGILQSGTQRFYTEVCVDAAYSGSVVNIILDTGSTCTQECNLGPLNYSFTVTGSCYSSSGTTIITPNQGTPPYTINNEIPGTLGSQSGTGPFTFSGLSASTYVFRLNDSSGGINEDLFINVTISDCFRARIYDATGTTCNEENGSLYVSATTTASPYTIVLFKDGNYYDLITTPTQPYQFTNLSAGTYYATFIDYGNVSANTGTAVIVPSTAPDFGFWKVDTSTCVINQGKLAVTGTTGTGPFTYLWSNGETTQLITGLTQGTYSCTVTDSLGCSTTKSETVNSADPLGVGLITAVNPSCFSSDGSLTYTITGGTRPLYYSASTSQVGYTFGDTILIDNLSSGSYLLNVRDANFCEINLTGFLSPPNGFNVVDSVITNSNCNQNDGSVYVEILGLGGFYTYALSGQTTGTVQTNTSLNQSYTFSNLPNDNYLLIISGSGTDCYYTSNITVNSDQKFTISATTSGSTCGFPNGQISIDVGSGYTQPLDYILSNGQSIIDSSLSSYTFSNLFAGSYTISVVDGDGCSVSENVTITTAGSLVSLISTTNCTNGSNGESQVIIYDGTPPFTYQWSSNVPSGQTGSTVSGLTAGTYSVLVTDNNSCTNNQNFNIVCTGVLVSSYEIISLCQDKFVTTTGNKRGFLEMLNEGFIDLTSGYTNCTFNSAEFICGVNVNGSAFTQSFYTATTLNDIPQDTLWQSTIENILSGIVDISNYTIDIVNNQLQIQSNCSGDYDPLSDADFSLELEIIYDIECEDGSTPTPTPTPTPTLTPINCSMSGYTFEINQP